MPVTDPVLCQRIPTAPWGDPADRKTVDYDAYVKTGGYQALEQALSMKPEAIVETVKESQLRGRGGAGFPCGLKWTFLPEPDGGRRYLAVNCDEAEPGTFKDRLLVDFDPHLVLEGIAISCYACQLDTAYFFIRGEYRHQAKIMEKAIKEAYDNGIFGKKGLLGGKSKFAVECYLHRSAGAYICGEETGLLESLEGKRGWPRIKPPFPAVEGPLRLGPRSSTTSRRSRCSRPLIVENGADWFRSIGVDSATSARRPRATDPSSMGVSGHVNKPGVYEVDLGIPMKELIETTSAAGCVAARSSRARSPAACPWASWAPTSSTRRWTSTSAAVHVMGLGTAGVDRHGRGHRHGRGARNISRFFKPRVVRPVHAVPRGQRWLYKLLCRIEAGDATQQGPRPAPGAGRLDGHHARHDDLRPRRRQQLGGAHDRQQVPRRVRGTREAVARGAELERSVAASGRTLAPSRPRRIRSGGPDRTQSRLSGVRNELSPAKTALTLPPRPAGSYAWGTMNATETAAAGSDDAGPAGGPMAAEPEPEPSPAEDEVPPEPAGDGGVELVDCAGRALDAAWLRDRIGAAASQVGDVRRLGVRIVNDPQMAALHDRHRGEAVTTDVLAFPASGPGEPIDVDIAVCVDVATRVAEQRGYPVERELLLYVLHGLLHCAGHDDHTQEAFDAMHAREDEILAAIGVGATFRESEGEKTR